MMPCPYPRTHYVHPGIEVHDYCPDRSVKAGMSENQLYARRPSCSSTSRQLRVNKRRRRVQKIRRDYNDYGYNDGYDYRLLPPAVPSDLSIHSKNDLGKYHYFCTYERETALNQEPATEPSQYAVGSINQDLTLQDRLSWSNAYRAFDYWCFYRIEMLKYQLQQQALHHQQ